MTFDETFDAMYELLARYCYRLGGDRDVAEDIAQEAMVRFFERGIEGSEAGVRSWLFKTATHLVRDRYRVEENRKRLLQETPVTPMPPSTPEQSLEVNETRALARSALNILPERDKEMLLLRYSGFSYREIADVLDVAATSVGTLLSRAEQKFSKALETTGGTQ